MESANYLLTDISREEREKNNIEREYIQYDQLEKTQKVDLVNGFFTFTKQFKYLGSYISYNLMDNLDIEACIMSATKEMGALKTFWENPHVVTNSKYLIFQAIPINLLLWGCES